MIRFSLMLPIFIRVILSVLIVVWLLLFIVVIVVFVWLLFLFIVVIVVGFQANNCEFPLHHRLVLIGQLVELDDVEEDGSLSVDGRQSFIS